MVVRTSWKHKSQFFGCANYRDTHCRHTVSIHRAFEGVSKPDKVAKSNCEDRYSQTQPSTH